MQGYTDALNTFRWTEIVEAARKEASRQNGLMLRWLKWAEETNDEELIKEPWVAKAIGAAKKYQFGIYNLNKKIKEIDRKLKGIAKNSADPDIDPRVLSDMRSEATSLTIEKVEVEQEQLSLVNRILRVFTMVHGTVTLSNGSS
jgi:hypothetical protein